MKPYPLKEHGLPAVQLSGWAYPNSALSVLKDSAKLIEVSAKGDATFIVVVDNLTKGLYTFSLKAQDTDGIISAAYPSTFWIEENTQTNVGNIIIPPTIKLASDSVDLGANILVSGQSIPNQKVNIELVFPKNQLLIKKQEELVNSTGRWSSIFSTTGLEKGIYELSAQSFHPDVGWSTYSERVKCGIGQKLDQGPCSRSDINKDGKINLVDFSILMYYWGTTTATADINSDGKINLVDFSILMYCWTG